MRRISVLKSLLILPVLALPVTALAQGGAKTLSLIPTKGPLAGKQIYANSHALLIGVNVYSKLPKDKSLQYAVNDVKGMRDMLIKSYGFPAENITVLTDSQATKSGIETAMAKLSDTNKVGPDDRVLIYFSGHGMTVKIPTGGDLGFLIPSDAEVDLANAENAGPYMSSCVKMSTIWNTADAMPAKHVLFIADACYSGLMTAGRGGNEKITEAFMLRLASKPARQVLTAGGAGEESFEDPKYGHGMFTHKLLEELKARAAEPGDAFMVADLYSAVKVAVGNLTNAKQNPQMKDYNTEGQFLFITTGGKAVKPLPAGQPAAATVPADVKATDRPSNKKRAVVMEISIAGISGNLPARFDEVLTGLLTFGLTNIVDREKVSVIDRKSLDLINEQRNLTGSGDKIPGADILIAATVKDFKMSEVGIGGNKSPLGKIGGLFGKGPKLPGGITVSRKEALVTLDVKAISAKTGETLAQFQTIAKEAVTDVGLEFDGLMRGFEVSSKFFDGNPVGKALKAALNKAVDQLAKEVEKAKV